MVRHRDMHSVLRSTPCHVATGTVGSALVRMRIMTAQTGVARSLSHGCRTDLAVRIVAADALDLSCSFNETWGLQQTIAVRIDLELGGTHFGWVVEVN